MGKKCQNVWVGTFVLIFKLICVARTTSINGLISGTHYIRIRRRQVLLGVSTPLLLSSFEFARVGCDTGTAVRKQRALGFPLFFRALIFYESSFVPRVSPAGGTRLLSHRVASRRDREGEESGYRRKPIETASQSSLCRRPNDLPRTNPSKSLFLCCLRLHNCSNQRPLQLYCYTLVCGQFHSNFIPPSMSRRISSNRHWVSAVFLFLVGLKEDLR